MIAVLHSEWIKLRTVRMNVVLFIVAVAFPVVIVGLTASLTGMEGFTAESLVGVVAGSSVVTGMLLGVVGLASIAGEFAHGTIRPTFAATPRRWRVLVAKSIVVTLFAAVAEALVVVISYSLGAAIATRRGATIELSKFGSARAGLVGVVVFAVIVALLGYGIGMLIRNLPAGIAVLLLWPLVVENLIVAILGAAGVEHPLKLMPYISGIQLGNPGEHDPETLGRIAGGAYFAAVTVAVALIGAAITTRRDA